MSQLIFSSIPGFFDIADSAFAGGQPLTDDSLLKLSHNAKFAAVRTELIFMGFFAAGNTIPAPVSPVDGYPYGRAECMFIPLLASSRSPAAGFVPGQAGFPALAASDPGTGSLIVCPYQLDINDSTGILTCQTYWSTSGAENQGTVKVLLHSHPCQREHEQLIYGSAVGATPDHRAIVLNDFRRTLVAATGRFPSNETTDLVWRSFAPFFRERA